MILGSYEAILSLADSEVAFMNGDVDVPRTSIHSQVPVHDTRPGQHWLEVSFSPPYCHFSSIIWVKPGTSAAMPKIKVMPLAYCCASGARILMRTWALRQLRKSLSPFPSSWEKFLTLHSLNFNELLTPLYFVIVLLRYNYSGFLFLSEVKALYKWTCKR